MDICRIQVLRGPNVWARCPVLVAEVRLPAEVPAGLVERLMQWLPGLASGAGGFARGLHGGMVLADALWRVTLEFQRLARAGADFGRAGEAEGTGLYHVVAGYEYEDLGRACLLSAQRVCLTVAQGQPLDLEAEVIPLRAVRRRARRGAGATAIVQAARARGIPVEPIEEDPCNLHRLGHGTRQRRAGNGSTDRTGAVAQTLTQDKELTRRLLRQAGIPVPEGRPVASAEDAWEAARQVGLPVVVKPRDRDVGRGVCLNLTTREEVQVAYEVARKESSRVLVERQAPGSHYRLLVIGGRLVAAVRRDPAQVVGDGARTVGQLIEEVNAEPRRGDEGPLWEIRLDDTTRGALAEQGYTLDSVPPAGAVVLARRSSAIRDGGTVVDVTEEVHPEVAARAVEAARVIGLDIAGLDVVVVDIGRPLEEQGGIIVEVNDFPWLGQHVEPMCVPPRPVGEAIVDLLFPEGETGRIPVVAVSGTGDGTVVARMVAHLLGLSGRLTGLACAGGIHAGGRRIEAREANDRQGALTVLANPLVEAAVLEVAPRSILDEGLGFDLCDVAIIAFPGREEETARAAKVLVESVAPGGALVLDADEPQAADLAGHCRGQVIFFSRNGDSQTVTRHRSAGGKAVLAREGTIVLADGEREEMLRGAGGAEGDALAAIAAVWTLGLPDDVLAAGLRSFPEIDSV